MRNKALLIALLLIVLIGGAFFAGMLAYLIAGGEGTTLAGSLGGKKVGVVTVEGPIISAKDTVEDIERFRKDGGIASVVLRIESPGGSVAAAQEILEAVKKLAKDKPVVASMGSVAASGGYYIACGATKILANPATITGSIGVRMEHVMIGDLLRWAKIDHETLKSGRFKDLAPIDRPMTPQERAIIQDMLVDMHQQFKEAVEEWTVPKTRWPVSAAWRAAWKVSRSRMSLSRTTSGSSRTRYRRADSKSGTSMPTSR